MLIAPNGGGSWHLSSIFQLLDMVDSPSFPWHNRVSVWLNLCVRVTDYRWCPSIDSLLYYTVLQKGVQP